MRDALETFWPASELSIQPTGSFFWTTWSRSCFHVIDFTSLWTGCIGRGIWNSRCIYNVAAVSSSLVGIMWRLSHCHINSVAIITSVAQRGGFHMCAVVYCTSWCLLFPRIICQSSCMIKSAHLILGFSPLQSIVFWPSCVFSSSHMMVSLVTSVPILVTVFRLVVPLFRYQRYYKYLFTILGSITSSTGLQSSIRLGMRRSNIHTRSIRYYPKCMIVGL